MTTVRDQRWLLDVHGARDLRARFADPARGSMNTAAADRWRIDEDSGEYVLLGRPPAHVLRHRATWRR